MAKQMCTITQVNKKLDINKIDNRCPTVKQYNGKTINNKVISIKGRKDNQLFPIDEMILTDAKHIFNLTVTITSKRDDEDLIINFIPGNGGADLELWQKLGFWEFLEGSFVEVVKQSWSSTNHQWVEETYVSAIMPADMYWGDLKMTGGDITKSIPISESAVKDNFIKSFKINDFEIIGNKLEKDKYIVNFIFNNPKDTSRPINLAMNFDITSSRDADNLIFNFEVINTNTNPDLLTKYTKTGMIYISGYYIDKTDNSWKEFTCDYRYSNETSNLFRFKETEITKSKEKGNKIQRPATGEYHNIDSWIKEIRLDGRIIYNSNYPISLRDYEYKNPINLTFNISGNTDASRPAVNPIIMEIDDGSFTPGASVYLNEYNVKVKNPALCSCTAYIQYNGTIGKRMFGDDDGRLMLMGNFKSTYKLSYDPKTSDDSTLTVKRLSLDIKMQNGGLYQPQRDDIIVLSGVSINKFESQSSVFDSMILYYPKWIEYRNEYNMVYTTAPLE